MARVPRDAHRDNNYKPLPSILTAGTRSENAEKESLAARATREATYLTPRAVLKGASALFHASPHAPEQQNSTRSACLRRLHSQMDRHNHILPRTHIEASLSEKPTHRHLNPFKRAMREPIDNKHQGVAYSTRFAHHVHKWQTVATVKNTLKTGSRSQSLAARATREATYLTPRAVLKYASDFSLCII